MIESVNNEKIINYAKLNQKKYRDLNNMYIVEGMHLYEEAMKKNLVIDAFSLDGSVGTKVTENVMKKLSSLDTVPNVLSIVKKEKDNIIEGNVLILDGIQNPGNLGTIIRSAVAFNIKTIIATPNTVDLYNSKVLRATEGMIYHINYIELDYSDIKNNLKNYTIYTTNVINGKSIDSIKINNPYALIIGNEGKGVSDELASIANETIYIPMNENCESLNAGVSASIILYEFNKKHVS